MSNLTEAQVAELKILIKAETEKLEELREKISQLTGETNKSQDAFTAGSLSVAKWGAALTGAVTIPIVSFFIGATKTAAQFEQAMAGVAAISGATGDGFERLKDQAKDLGATTRYTAVQAAEGMTMLARAGWEVDEILSGMPGMLNLAAAGAVDLGIAADIVSDVMMAFGANASEAGRYADVFAAAAASANTTVEALGQAMAYAAPAAAAAGFSIEQTAAALSSLADAGIKGTRAGTTMDSVIRELRNKVKDGALDFGEFTVAVYDNEGAMRDLFSILGDIESGMSGMTQESRDAALGMIFTTRSMRGMNVWLTRGVDSLRDLEGGLLGASGAADVMAGIMMNTLQGSMIELSSATEGLKIAFGEFFLEAGQKTVRSLTDVVRWITNADDATKRTIVTVSAIAAAIGPLLTMIGTLGIVFKALAGQMALMMGTVLPVTVALLALGVAVVAITKAIIDEGVKSQLAYERMASTIIAETEAMGRAYAAQYASIKHEQAARHVDEIQAEIDHLIAMGHTVDTSTELVDAYARLNAAIAAENAAFRRAELLKDAAFKASLEAAPDSNETVRIWKEYLAIRDTAIMDATQTMIEAYYDLADDMEFSDADIQKGLNSVYRWAGEMSVATGNAANRVMMAMQAEFAAGGEILDYETNLLVPIVSDNAGEIVKQWTNQLGVLPEEAQKEVLSMISSFNIAARTGDVEGMREWAVKISEVIATEGVNWEESAYFALGDVMNAFVTEGPKVVDAWRTSFGEVEGVTAEVWEGTMATLESIMTGPFSQDVKAHAESIIRSMGEGFEDASPEVLTSMDTLLTSIEGQMLLMDYGPAAQALAETVGKGVVLGIDKGMLDMLPTVDTTVKEMSDRIVNGTRRTLESQSPSKVMMRIGNDVVEGLAQGITDKLDLIKSTLEQLKATIEKIITDTVDNVIKIWDNMVRESRKKAMELTQDVKRQLEGLFDYIKRLPSQAYGWGRDILTKLWQGMRSVFSSIQSWFNTHVKSLLNQLNPWARQSPSLIDNIESGVKEIESLYKSINLPDFNKFVPTGTGSGAGDGSSQSGASTNDTENYIYQAFKRALDETEHGDVVLKVNGKELARIVKESLQIENWRVASKHELIPR